MERHISKHSDLGIERGCEKPLLSGEIEQGCSGSNIHVLHYIYSHMCIRETQALNPEISVEQSTSISSISSCI